MALNISDIYTELTTLLVGVDSALTANVWEAEHAAMFTWAERTLPMAVTVLNELPNSDDWGCTNQAIEVEAEIYYAMEVDGPATALRAKLEAIYDALITTSYAPTGFQVLEVSAINYSRSLQPNQMFAEKGGTQRVGLVRVKLLIGQVQS